MSSAALTDLMVAIREQGLDLHALLVIRGGQMVLEVYWHPYTPDDPHAIYSATKSVTSAVVTMAIADGAIPSLDTPMLEFFPDREIANLDDRKRAITIRHLLTMTSGLDWRRPADGGPHRSASWSWPMIRLATCSIAQ